MEGNFVADVRVEDQDQVIQLPVVKNRVKKLLQGAVKRLALLGAPVIPSSDDSLQQFLQATGRFFGKDPEKWEQMGDIKVDVSEENAKRTTKSTGTFTGTELHLLVESPYFDERLPVREERPELTFNVKKRFITDDAQWQELISDQPWTPSRRRQLLAEYLHAKVEAEDDVLAVEGAHGFWELAIRREHHTDIRIDRLAALMNLLGSNNLNVATTTAAALWGLSTTAPSRRNLADLDVVSLLLSNIKRTLKMPVVPDPGDGTCPEGVAIDTMRNEYQAFLLGALAVQMVDRSCRRPYLALEPDFTTLFALCKPLEGYSHDAAVNRRETAAKTLASMIQRDPDARRSLVRSGALRSVLSLLNPKGPGEDMIRFCAASLLATLVLDDDSMEVIRERGEAPIMFQACILLLSSTLEKLLAEVARQISILQNGGVLPEEGEEGAMDLDLGVRLAEAASQAMWGSAHYCVLTDPIQISMDDITLLGKMGMDCYKTEQLPLSRVCHCITATLATLSASPDAAQLIMTAPDDVPLHMLFALVEVFETETFEQASHVKASACAGIAFLACHPIGAEGDECMNGPYRTKLLKMGAFGALLRAALTSVLDPECDVIIQQAAAIGVMYLSTMAGAVDAGELAMYSALLMDSHNSEMIEFLMAGMWILLRNADNRKVLGTSFKPKAGSALGKSMMSKLNDAITLHDITSETEQKINVMRQVRSSMCGQAAPTEEEAALEGTDAAGVDDDLDLPPVGTLEGLEVVAEEDEEHADSEGGQSQSASRAVTSGTQGSQGRSRLGSAAELVTASRNGSAPAGPGGATSSNTPAADGEYMDDAALAHRRTSGNGASPSFNSRGGHSTNSHRGLSSSSSNSSELKAHARRLKAADAKAKVKEMEQRFDKELKDDWGLETLVTVGESWLPAMLAQDAVGEANDFPVLKLFEFLVASICLFMIEDDSPPERRDFDLYSLTAPAGMSSKTWWTVDAPAPQPEPVVDGNVARALVILLQLTGMRLPQAWKSVQLGVLTLWNACARNPNMEARMVEMGVGSKLLSIINHGMWPASLRDISAGCLEFLFERHCNLAFLGTSPLPEGVDYPLQEAPHMGLVPMVNSLVTLINSKVPLLEYRGCHGLARTCYSAPFGCPNPKDLMSQCKALVNALGGLDALIALLRRMNKRYSDLEAYEAARSAQPVVSKPPPARTAVAAATAMAAAAPRTAADGVLADSNAYERDMSTREALQDLYHVLLAALANASVLRSNLVPLARKGLMTLLGTASFLYQQADVAAAAAVGGHGGGGIREHQLLDVVSAIIQNLSLHPHNRTRMYKAELRGTIALDFLIERPDGGSEGGGGDDDHNAHSPSSFLPHLHVAPDSPTHRHGSPARGGTCNISGCGAGTTRGPHSPSKAQQGWTARMRKMSPNGAVLNASVDTAFASSVRPKVVFPPIVDKTDRTMERRPGDTSRRPTTTNNGSSRASGTGLYSQSGELLDEPEYMGGGGNDPSSDSRNRFLSWIDNTFADLDGPGQPAFKGGSKDGGGDHGGKKSYRKAMWDENGDWLEDEPESMKALNKLLCRPLNHLWNETPEVRIRHGQARWEPSVSEYREPKTPQTLTRPAARLLQTKPPVGEDQLMSAAEQMISTGRFTNTSLQETTSERPPTRERDNGRMGLTVLQPHAAGTSAPDSPKASRTSPAVSSSVSGRDKREILAMLAAARQGPDVDTTAVPLKVCLGPRRARQVISFEDRIIVDNDASRPVLTMFEHVEGSRVGEGLFPCYNLPNGKKAYMYYNGGALLDEVHVDAVVPPPRPSTVPQALQQAMPLAAVLNLIAKPPGSAPPFIPYKPVPRLVPLPGRHTLTVKRPDLRTAEAYGDLREDNLQLLIQARKIIKTSTTTRTENIEIKPQEEREPWLLPNSIFKARLKECDAHAFFDSSAVEEKMFDRDWQRACAKEKFSSMLSREHKANKAGGKDDRAMMVQLREVLLKHYHQIYSAFVYYASTSSGDPYHMSLNAFTSWLDECCIADSEAPFIKRSDCDTIFIVCNFQPDKKSAEAQVNQENAMMRYEYLEAICRAALAKYGKGLETDDVADAVEMLVERNLVARMPPSASLSSNVFRNDRLYNEDVDLGLKKHTVLLKALYSRYRLKPSGGGLRYKVLKLDGWLQLMSDAHLVDAQFTLQDATLAFLWSRMYTIDEIKDYAKYTCLSFVDFLEALGRVADAKSLPSTSDLAASNYENILEWALEKERTEGGDRAKEGENGDSMTMDLFRPRPSIGYETPKTRPLYVKLEAMLDLIFRRLYWDPAQPDSIFNYENLLKMVKKMDKDLGP